MNPIEAWLTANVGFVCVGGLFAGVIFYVALLLPWLSNVGDVRAYKKEVKREERIAKLMRQR